MDQDAILAAMLEDDTFVQDLMRRPDHYMGALGDAGLASSPRAPRSAPSGGSPPDASHPSEKFGEKFSALGAAAKAKLAIIASKFKRTKKGGGGIMNPSTQYRDLDLNEEGGLNEGENIELNEQEKRKNAVPDM